MTGTTVDVIIINTVIFMGLIIITNVDVNIVVTIFIVIITTVSLLKAMRHFEIFFHDDILVFD